MIIELEFLSSHTFRHIRYLVLSIESLNFNTPSQMNPEIILKKKFFLMIDLNTNDPTLKFRCNFNALPQEKVVANVVGKG